MLSRLTDQLITKAPGLQERGVQLSDTLHHLILGGGKPARQVADLLHGTWLGHPLHPLLTDLVVGAWSMAAVFDVMSLGDDSPHAEKAADTLTAIGTAAVIPTALSGLTDFSAVPKPAAGAGLAHAMATDVSFGLYLSSLWARKKGRRGLGIMLSLLGFGVAGLGAYLGGHLVFEKKVGVNRAEDSTEPQEWTAVLAEQALPANEPKTVTVKEQSVLLYRHDGAVYAVGAICPHAGAPLENGTFCDRQVECPWHESIFDLSDGSIVHGPSTYPLPRFATRTNEGQIEIRTIEPN